MKLRNILIVVMIIVLFFIGLMGYRSGIFGKTRLEKFIESHLTLQTQHK